MLTKEEMPACPVATTVQLIGSKWKLLILRNLLAHPWRFNELRKSLEGIHLFSPCQVGASFGMAECRPGMSPEQLLKNADSALYQAKEERGCIRRWEQMAT